MQLKIKVVEAKALRASDIGLTSDPYVELSIAGKSEKYKTKVIEKQLNPQWNEEFTIPIENVETDVVQINVLDQDMGQDDILGAGKITLNEFKTETEIDKWVDLEAPGALSIIKAGQVHVVFTLVNEKKQEVVRTSYSYSSSRVVTSSSVQETKVEENSAETQQESQEQEKKDENAEQNQTTEENKPEEEDKAENVLEEEEEINENQTDDERINKLKARIDLYHQKFLALKRGENGPIIPPRAELKIIVSPTIKNKQAEAQNQKDQAEEPATPVAEEEKPQQEEEELSEVQPEDVDAQSQGEVMEEENNEEENRNQEELNDVIKQVQSKADKIYARLLKKYEGLTQNASTLKEQKKQRDVDQNETDLNKLSIDKLKEIYNKLVRENKDLDKQIAQLESQ